MKTLAARVLSATFLIASLSCSQAETSREQEEATPLRIVCFGDSITGSVPRHGYLHKFIQWSDILETLIGSHLGWDQVEVLNRGWAGDTVAAKPEGTKPPGAITRYQRDLIDEKPDIAVILLGGNDAKVIRNQGTEEEIESARQGVYSGLTQIVSEARAAGIKVLLLQYHEAMSDDDTDLWVHLDDFNPVIAKVAEEQEVPLLSLAEPFRKEAAQRPTKELLNEKDGVHLNPYGSVVYAREVFLKLIDLGWLSN